MLRELPPAPLHGDWQTNNLFFDGDDELASSTSTRPTTRPRVLDLAVAVERNCFFWNRISAGEDDAHDLGATRGCCSSAYHEAAP